MKFIKTRNGRELLKADDIISKINKLLKDEGKKLKRIISGRVCMYRIGRIELHTPLNKVIIGGIEVEVDNFSKIASQFDKVYKEFYLKSRDEEYEKRLVDIKEYLKN